MSKKNYDLLAVIRESASTCLRDAEIEPPAPKRARAKKPIIDDELDLFEIEVGITDYEVNKIGGRKKGERKLGHQHLYLRPGHAGIVPPKALLIIMRYIRNSLPAECVVPCPSWHEVWARPRAPP